MTSPRASLTRYTIIVVNEKSFELRRKTTKPCCAPAPPSRAYRQLILDTTSAAPQHLAQTAQRRSAGARRHEDERAANRSPRQPVFDGDDRSERLDARGREYITDTLRNLPACGASRQLQGCVAAAEGMVLEDWNPDIHPIRLQT
jgi:hypothetical protein